MLQFACFIFMLVNALYIAISRIHIRWRNKRYERSRWHLVSALLLLALQYLLQMTLDIRMMSDNQGALLNILIYTPAFSLVSMGIYNIEATHDNRRRFVCTSASIYLAILAILGIAIWTKGSLHIGGWLYVLLALYTLSIVYSIGMIIHEMSRRRRILETMTATDMVPYMRYARISVLQLCIAVLIMPVAILSTTLLLLVGPFILLAMIMFTVAFVALGYSYQPTEELLDDEEEQEAEELKDTLAEAEEDEDCSLAASTTEPTLMMLSDQRRKEIEEKLDQWCQSRGYKDSSANMLTLSRSIGASKEELTLYFDHYLNSTFRIWLSDIRFKATQDIMKKYPEYSNDIISAECGFSSRTHLYRIFKTRTGCTPTEWRAKQAENKADSDQAE